MKLRFTIKRQLPMSESPFKNIGTGMSVTYINKPLCEILKTIGWRNWHQIRSIRIQKQWPKTLKYTFSLEAAEELKMISCDLEKELLKMMTDELDTFKVQKDLEYINRHRDELIKATGVSPEYLGEWPEEVVKHNADKIRQLEDQDALDKLKRLNEKITIDNPDSLHVNVPGDRRYPIKGE